MTCFSDTIDALVALGFGSPSGSHVRFEPIRAQSGIFFKLQIVLPSGGTLSCTVAERALKIGEGAKP